MPFTPLSVCPALRIVVPFALGIYGGDHLFFERVRVSYLSLSLFAVLLLLILWGIYAFVGRYALRNLFGYLTFGGFFVVGVCWSNICLQNTEAGFSSSTAVYRAVITDKPEEKEKSILCRARLLSVPDSLAPHPFNHPSVILYLAPDSAGRAIGRGDEILFCGRLSLPQPKGNPNEFDYSRYLIRKGISGTAYLASGQWLTIGHHAPASLVAYASDCRDSVLGHYASLGFEGDTFAILSALTVGYKDDLSETVLESFSVSGASHILALSGLHIGFLYSFLLFFLNQIPRSHVLLQPVRLILLLSVLWGFAILTGLSPSVVRSVIMFSLLAVSALFAHRPVSLNTLSVAALGMLIYQPGWLFDVGFQLSFVAVLSILLIYPRLYSRLSFENFWMKKIWGLAAVSIAAQIGTAPLVLFYFSRYSVHFLLTNIIVIPLVTLIIYIAIAMLLLSALPVISRIVASGLQYLIDLLHQIVTGIEHLPFASIDRVWADRAEIVLAYLIIASFTVYFAGRKSRPLVVGLGLVFLLATYRVVTIELNRPQQSIIFYNVRNCPAVHCVSPNGSSWLACADSLSDHKRLTRVVSNYWNRIRLSSPVVIGGDYADPHFVRHDNLLTFGGKRVYIVCDDRWKYRRSEAPLKIHYLYLCRGYTGRLEHLTTLFEVERFVLDPSLSDLRLKAFQAECDSLNIPYTSLSEQASYFKTSL